MDLDLFLEKFEQTEKVPLMSGSKPGPGEIGVYALYYPDGLPLPDELKCDPKFAGLIYSGHGFLSDRHRAHVKSLTQVVNFQQALGWALDFDPQKFLWRWYPVPKKSTAQKLETDWQDEIYNPPWNELEGFGNGESKRGNPLPSKFDVFYLCRPKSWSRLQNCRRIADKIGKEELTEQEEGIRVAMEKRADLRPILQYANDPKMPLTSLLIRLRTIARPSLQRQEDKISACHVLSDMGVSNISSLPEWGRIKHTAVIDSLEKARDKGMQYKTPGIVTESFWLDEWLDENGNLKR